MNRYIITVLLLFVSSTAWCADLFNRSYAVVIGITNYQNSSKWKKLDNAKNDAEAMEDFLKNQQGFEVQPFIDQNATKDNIIAYLEDTLAPILTKNDRLVFYFSGHGNTRLLGGRDRGYLIPYDGGTERSSTWIAMEQLQELADKLGNARHQLFILDACFGGLFATKSSMSSSREGTSSYIGEVTARRARQYLTAGGTNEETPARSALDGYRKYSHYTAYLLKGLREGDADNTRDGFITTSELDAYLGPAATTKYNKPRGGNFAGHEQGNFVFRSPKPAQIMVNQIPVDGPTKGTQSTNRYDQDKHDWKLLSKLGESGLERYLALHRNGTYASEARSRLKQLQRRPVQASTTRTNNITASTRVTRKPLSKEQQTQALYEWQQDIIYANDSRTVEQFLQRFPTGSHVQDARSKLADLRAQGF